MDRRTKRLLQRLSIIIAIIVVIGVVSYLATSNLTSSRPKVISVTTTLVTTTSVTTTSTIVPNITTTTTSIITQTKSITIVPPNSSQLIDVSWTAAPDALDPATGFYVQDGPLFSAIYQELVEFNGSSITSVVPVVAENWSTTNYQNWTFYIRQGVYFSDGVQVNASTVWFSFYRMILMGQGPGVANYIELLFNATQFSMTGYAIPWGVGNALHEYLHVNASNATAVAYALASILSHFNANNKTIQEIMSYPYQAVVVKGPYEVEISTLEPYRYFLYDIASWWGAMQDPVFVDAHGGVQPNTPNSYTDLNGMPGTGPYEISYVAQGFSEIKLVANPNYWVKNIPNIPAVAQPAHIPVIIIYYGLSHTDRVEDFDNNIAQISYVSIPFISQIYSGYMYKVPLTVIMKNEGSVPSTLYLSMNTQKWPTNITYFRKAVVHIINYTALLQLFEYNGTTLATYFIGPISPQYPVYNEVVAFDKLTPYSFNLSLAMHYMNEAGYAGDFYVVMPNGTILGNPQGMRLPTLPIYAIAPLTPLEESELELIQQDLELLGIPTSIITITPQLTDSWITPNGTPVFVMLGWAPDWPDPIFQQLMPLTDAEFGGISGNLAWVDIPQLQQIYQTLPFMTNGNLQKIMLAYVYYLIYNYTPYVWLPVPDTYFFVQPYLHGFIYNPFIGYWYNMIYYENYTYTYTITQTITTTTVIPG